MSDSENSTSNLKLNLSSLVGRQESESSLVRFEDTTDKNVPRLRYSVPLPGGISGRQYVIIEPRNVDWTGDAFKHNPVIDNLKEFIEDDTNLRPVSEIANVGIVNRHTTDDVSKIDEIAATIQRAGNIAAGTSTMAIESKEAQQLLEHYDEQPRFVRQGSNNELFIKVKDLEIPFSEVSSAAKRNEILTIYETFGGDTRYTFTDIETSGGGVQAMRPKFMIIEHYKLSSFFEDYGAGRTIGVFSLMPGEETTIKERHWRRTEIKEKSASSVFDSFTREAKNEFEEGFEEENTDKESYNESLAWHVKAKAEANFGVASASVEGGAEGSTASAREQLGKKASKTTKKHAESASNKRDISVTTEVEETTSEEFETIKERTLKNTNLSRTLNVVIRELNQEFVTYLSLVDVTIAFTNKGGIFDEYSISEIDRMLEKYVKPAPPVKPVPQKEPADETERVKLNLAAGQPTLRVEVESPLTRGLVRAKLLEQIRRVVDFKGVVQDLLEDEIDPWGNKYLRVKRRRNKDQSNPFYKEQDNIPVDGVVMNIDRNTIKTDSLIIDSLLGHGVALDNYALGMQQESLREKQLENIKTEIALKLIHENNEAKLEAFRSLFGSVDKKLLEEVVIDRVK